LHAGERKSLADVKREERGRNKRARREQETKGKSDGDDDDNGNGDDNDDDDEGEANLDWMGAAFGKGAGVADTWNSVIVDPLKVTTCTHLAHARTARLPARAQNKECSSDLL
jgi:hypothetical protein